MGTGAGRAMLRLDGFGNPIDLPVAVAIDVRGKGVSLVDPGFAPSLCRGRADGVRCELAAGANVLLSNSLPWPGRGPRPEHRPGRCGWQRPRQTGQQ